MAENIGGIAWVDRQNDNDFDGLRYAVGAMVRKEQNFKALGENEQDILDCFMDGLDGLDCRGGMRLCRAIRTLL